MVEPRDYYETLGISRDADPKAVKEAFRQLALKYHPDRNKEPGASDRFREIAEAYAVLTDPKKRAEYDARGHAGVAGFSQEDLFGGIDFEDIFRGFGFDMGGPGVFDRWFGRRAASGRGADLEVVVTVPLERILQGGEQTVGFVRLAACDACQGSGAKAGTKPRTCAKCGGSGQLVSSRKERNVTVQQIRTCSECGGRGTIIDTPCPQCGGKGQVARDEPLTVRIPVGAEEGMALRIPGHGSPAEAPGQPAGDLLVIVRTADSRFERRGRDLHRAETVDVVDAVLGTSIDVPTLDGPASVKVPAGTQPDSLLRLRGKGLPPFGGGSRGDLYVRIQVHVPERLSDQQRRLFEQVRASASAKTTP